MEITNHTASGVYTNDYKNKSMPKQDYENTMKMKMPETGKKENKILGMGFLHDKNSPVSYGMVAMYAEDYSEENPVIKVNVTKPNGKEEYRININEVNPRNASEIEMFALCNYADAKGSGTGGTFGSWQTLNYYKDNAAHNGYFGLSDTMEQFKSLRQDWGAMVSAMINDYMNGGLFKQAMDGKMLLGLFQHFMQD